MSPEDGAPDEPLPPLPVHGYTPQPQGKIDLVNRNKHIEELVLRRIDELRGLGMDARLCAMAKTQIEIGFMCLNRAIFLPERIEGPLNVAGHTQ